MLSELSNVSINPPILTFCVSRYLIPLISSVKLLSRSRGMYILIILAIKKNLNPN